MLCAGTAVTAFLVVMPKEEVVVNGMTVASVMTKNVVTVAPDTPFRELVEALTGNEISALPVLDRHGRPIGVVSEVDLLAKQEFHSGRNAAEVMTTPVRAVHADEPVGYAARLLAKAGIRRLFVIDWDGRLTGVVSRRDLLRVYLCDDEELRARTAELLLVAGVAPGAVEVRVQAGMVTVDGAVTRRGLADAAVRMVRALPGVVCVRDNVRYELDDTVTSPR